MTQDQDKAVSATDQPEHLSQEKNETSKNEKWEKVRAAQDDNAQNDSIKPNKDSLTSEDSSADSNANTSHEELEERLKKLEQRLAEVEKEKESQQLYHLAELKNVHARAAKDNERAQHKGYEKAVEAFIPLNDSLDASLNHSNGTVKQYQEGAQHILKQMQNILEKLGITIIVPSVGDAFDPYIHTAAGTEAVDKKVQAPDTIVKVFQKGYKLKERIIRPAMVIVSKVEDQKVEEKKDSI